MGHLDDETNSPFRRRNVYPSNILDVMRIAHPIFRGFYQQDSTEFLRAFLGDLHDELKITPFNESKYPPLDSDSSREYFIPYVPFGFDIKYGIYN